jgi:DNA repair protein SbcD/Mre11
MKILHTSDWHLGQHFYGKSRAKEHQAFLQWLLEQVEQQKLDAIVVAGDIFDTGTPPSYARELYFDFVGKMNAKGCQLIVLAGNHDSVAMLSESKSVLGYLNTQVIALASEDYQQQVFTITDKTEEQTLLVCAIPFIRPRDVVKSQAGQSAKEKQTSLQQGIAQHYQRLYDSAREINATAPILMTGHLTTVGASTSDSVREIYIGTLDAFPSNAFPPADYIALGHIHKPQLVAKSEHIRYCGSPIPLSFDEAKQDKQVVIAEFDHEKLLNTTSVKIPRFQPMTMLKTTVDDLPTDIAKLATELDSSLTLWLDIEIITTGYLQDISERVQTLVKDLPIEVLMIRRNKETRLQMINSERNLTLNELTVDEVFEERLSLEDWQEESANARKERLKQLFNQFAHPSHEGEQES